MDTLFYFHFLTMIIRINFYKIFRNLVLNKVFFQKNIHYAVSGVYQRRENG